MTIRYRWGSDGVEPFECDGYRPDAWPSQTMLLDSVEDAANQNGVPKEEAAHMLCLVLYGRCRIVAMNPPGGRGSLTRWAKEKLAARTPEDEAAWTKYLTDLAKEYEIT